MHVSKRSLGEGYIVAVGVVLGSVLLGQMFRDGAVGLFWMVAAGVPLFALVGAIYWLQRLDLTSEQVWTVANYSAVGLGIGTVLLVVVELVTPAATVSSAGSALLGTTLATMAVAGAFGGVVVSLRGTQGELRRQNAVLHRVLRHNLRNDMTVVMCMLDDIEAASDGEPAGVAREAQEKIRSIVRLTDKVRQASVRQTGQSNPPQPLDVTDLVEARLEELQESHPELDIETELSESAPAHVDEAFGLVVDNIVECALGNDDTTPDLSIRVRADRGTVTLVVADYSQTLPDADFSAVAAGAETALEHGLGVELWLVDWLVNANDGDVSFDADDGIHRVTIELDCARPGWLRA